MNDHNHITARIVPDAERMAFVDALFGLRRPDPRYYDARSAHNIVAPDPPPSLDDLPF